MSDRNQYGVTTTRRWVLVGAATTALLAATRKVAALLQGDSAPVIRTPVPDEPGYPLSGQGKDEALDNPIDASDFGARGDGSTDDTAALQSAMEAASREQRPLVIRPGSYLVSRSLFAPSNLTMHGYGATLVTLIPELGNAGVIVGTLMIDGVTNVSVHGLAIDGRKAHYAHTEYKAGICIHNASNVEIHDCDLYDCKGDGLICFWQFIDEGNRNVTVVNTTMRGNYRLGCAITDLVGGHFVNCRFIDNTGTAPMSGLDIEPHDGRAWIDDLLFEHCDFSRNGTMDLHTGAGVLVALVPERTNPQGNIRFRDCVMNDNATMGALLLVADGVTFEGCEVKRNADAGIGLLDTASGVAVIGGTITRNAFDGVRVEMLEGESLARLSLQNVLITDNSQDSVERYDGVSLVGWCRDVAITQCHISGSHRYGVWVDDVVENVTLSENSLEGNAIGAVFPEHLLEEIPG